jgi:hypothetical protein
MNKEFINTCISNTLIEIKSLEVFKSEKNLDICKDIMESFVFELNNVNCLSGKLNEVEIKLLNNQKKILEEGLKKTKSNAIKISYEKQLANISKKLNKQKIDIGKIKEKAIKRGVIYDGVKRTDINWSSSSLDKFNICLDMLWNKLKLSL